ncbi:hypothetical protein ACFVAJ_03670 [Agromyces sp. NPDC057679]|uniref:hypothetical protein n=1 Tax=Agromyces sp. NPDC057679 TaxID=3346207 RepID=UPI00366E8393
MTATVSTLDPAAKGRRLAADDLQRQCAHWQAAASAFLDAEEFAPSSAWAELESQTGLPLRQRLGAAVDDLVGLGGRTRTLAQGAARSPTDLVRASRAVQVLRRRYTQVETTLDFFGDAVSSRTSPGLRSTMRLLDGLADASMRPVLVAARQPVPPSLTYVKPGMGASILRAGIRLWSPGTINPVAAIKIVRHNLYRPTSLFHETGHQVAHLTGWTPSVRRAIAAALADDPALQRMWSPWASEIAADAYAFLHTGFASVSALYDVVGDTRTVLRWPVGDPHPIGWLRTRLGCAFCRAAYGAGPWDRLEAAMLAEHPIERAEPALQPLLARSSARMPQLAPAVLAAPVPGLGGREMSTVVDPRRVSPAALGELERAAGSSAWTSPHWRRTEGIRLVALAGLREAELPGSAPEWIDRARRWMTGAAA